MDNLLNLPLKNLSVEARENRIQNRFQAMNYSVHDFIDDLLYSDLYKLKLVDKPLIKFILEFDMFKKGRMK